MDPNRYGGEIYGPDSNDPLLATIEALLREDIPDPNRRGAVAAMIRAHAKASSVHSLRQVFDPYLGIGAVKPTVEEALTVMRGAVMRLAGYDRADPEHGAGEHVAQEDRAGTD